MTKVSCKELTEIDERVDIGRLAEICRQFWRFQTKKGFGMERTASEGSMVGLTPASILDPWARCRWRIIVQHEFRIELHNIGFDVTCKRALRLAA